jgi:hypothetical protein
VERKVYFGYHTVPALIAKVKSIANNAIRKKNEFRKRRTGSGRNADDPKAQLNAGRDADDSQVGAELVEFGTEHTPKHDRHVADK